MNTLEANLFEQSVPGRSGYHAPAEKTRDPRKDLPAALLRQAAARLPEVTELQVVRHFTRLSQRNYSVDTHLYPLGSCTMKYNPRVNEKIASMDAVRDMHPYRDENDCQGLLGILHETERLLATLCGFEAVTLQPAAGAHGELTAMLVIRKHFDKLGDPARTRVIVPDSSHGTNPASAALAGFSVTTIASAPDGGVDLDALNAQLDGTVAAVMLTNPSTLGLFERRLPEIAQVVHRNGSLLYCDGANMNALMGIFRPGEGGFDLMHLNLHKTFASPHGGGGPGAGPVCVKKFLEPFLPGPRVAEQDGVFSLAPSHPDSIGRVKGFYGHAGVIVRAWAYIRQLGGAGLREASLMAVLNANYLKKLVEDFLAIPYPRACMHEFVAQPPEGAGLHTMDIAKRLMDYDIHPPTIYFPLIVKEALMIEPTETESPEDLERLADALRRIVAEGRADPESLHRAPTTRFRKRLDEVTAARNPVLREASHQEPEPSRG